MKTIATAIAILLLSIPSAHADFFFDVGSPSGSPGSTILVDVFIRADPGNSFNSLRLADFLLNAAPGAGNSTITNFTVDSQMTGNFLFPNSVSFTPTQLTAQLGATSTNPGAIPTLLNRVRLGQLSILVGTAPTTAFTFNDGNFRDGNNVIVNTNLGNQVVDAQVFAAPRNSFSVVPEPGSGLMLLGLAAFGHFRYRNRQMLPA